MKPIADYFRAIWDHPSLVALRTSSVWVLVLPAIVLLGITDIALLKTLLQWGAFSLVLAGVSIIVSMVVFPQINLTSLVLDARGGNVGSAIVAASLVIFLGLLFYSLIFWAKT